MFNVAKWTHRELVEFLTHLAISRRQGKRWLRQHGGDGTALELDLVLPRVRCHPTYESASSAVAGLVPAKRPPEFLVATEEDAFPTLKAAQEYRDNERPDASIYRGRRVE